MVTVWKRDVKVGMMAVTRVKLKRITSWPVLKWRVSEMVALSVLNSKVKHLKKKRKQMFLSGC